MRRRGLTLMEVIVTSSLLGLCALFLLNILPGAMLSVRQSEHRLGASALAKAIVDECLAGPYAGLEVAGTYDLTSAGRFGDLLRRQEYMLDDHTRLEPQLRVSHDSVLPPANLAFLTVTVKWRERNMDFEIVRNLRLSSASR